MAGDLAMPSSDSWDVFMVKVPGRNRRYIKGRLSRRA